VGCAVLGVDFDCLSIGIHGLVDPAGGRECVAKVIVDGTAQRSYRKGRTTETDSLFRLLVPQEVPQLEVEPQIGRTLVLRDAQ
jgi:hypothetical protein